MGPAQNGTGVMAEQMEIHPGRNDVINAAESTSLPRMGKPSHGSTSFYPNQHTLNFIHECFYPKALSGLVLLFFECWLFSVDKTRFK